MTHAPSTLELPPAALNRLSGDDAEAGEVLTRLEGRSMDKAAGFKRLIELADPVRGGPPVGSDALADVLRAGLIHRGIDP